MTLSVVIVKLRNLIRYANFIIIRLSQMQHLKNTFCKQI